MRATSSIAKSPRLDLERSERQLVGYAQSQEIMNRRRGRRVVGRRLLVAGRIFGCVEQGAGRSDDPRDRGRGRLSRRAIERQYDRRQRQHPGDASVEASLEAAYQDKRTLIKPNPPDVLSLRNRTAELDRQIRIETAQVVGGRSNTLFADYQAAAAERAQGRVGSLKGSVFNLRGRSINIPSAATGGPQPRALRCAASANLFVNLLIGLALGLLSGMGLAIALDS